MTEKPFTENRNGKEPEDLLAIVERMRSLPRIKPSRAFKARMFLYAHIPSLGIHMAKKREASNIERLILGEDARKHGGWVASAARVSAAIALVLLLAFGVFGTLIFAAGNSKPGDALYSMKRFGENLELAFTWSDTSRAQKNLSLALARLSELDYLISRKDLDVSEVKSIVSDYGDRTRTVEDMLSRDGSLTDAQGVASQLKVVKTTEKDVEKRLAAAGSQASLAVADNAGLTVRDSTGNPSVSGKSALYTRTDTSGRASFVADLGATRAGDLEVLVEDDGRTEILPVYPVAERPAGGALRASVTPEASALVVGQPQMFTLTLVSKGDGPVAGRRIRLRDTSGTSYINGSFGDANVFTDDGGTCTFTLTKQSIDHVSHITAALLDGTAADLGEVLTVGGLKTVATSSDPGTVTATAVGPATGPQNVNLDNGLINLGASGNTPGKVIDSLVGAGVGMAGPLYDPLAGDSSHAAVKTTGPRLTFASPEAAGYEVSFEFPVSGATVTKTYLVELGRGNRYATVRCRIEVAGTSGDSSSMLDACRLASPTGARVEISGKQVAPVTGAPVPLVFFPGAPSAVISSAGSNIVMACPIDTETYPETWIIGSGFVGFRLPQSAGQAGADSSMTVLIGIADNVNLESLEGIAVHGVGDVKPVRASALPTDGFLVVATPTSESLSRGKQSVTLRVFKQYKTVFDR
jgi:hypothetical protein